MTGLAEIPHSCSPTSTNIREATRARGLQRFCTQNHEKRQRGLEKLSNPSSKFEVRVYIYTGAMLFHNSVNSKLCNWRSSGQTIQSSCDQCHIQHSHFILSLLYKGV